MKKELRKPIGGVFVAFFQWQIISIILLFYAYVCLVVYGLEEVKVWDFSQLKNTIVWSVFVGIAAIFRTVTEKEADDPLYFRNWIFDNLKVIAFVEFLVSLKPFSLLAELILQPFIVLLSMCSALAEFREEHKKAGIFCGYILACIVLWILAHTGISVWEDYSEYANFKTFQDFYTPLVLSIALTPFLYALYIYASYQRIFTGLIWAFKDDEELRKYAKRRAILSFRLDIDFLDRWRRKILLTRPDSKEAVIRSIEEIKSVKKLENNPPEIEPVEGWSPYKAQKFLADHEVSVGDYHEQYGEWFASAPYLEIGDEILLKDNIAYYLNGHRKAVTSLKLVLNVNNPQNGKASESQFFEVAKTLYKRAVSEDVADEFNKLLKAKNKKILLNSYLQASIETEKWEGGIKGGYSKKVIFEIISSQAQ